MFAGSPSSMGFRLLTTGKIIRRRLDGPQAGERSERSLAPTNSSR